MKDFDIDKRSSEMVFLDQKTNAGKNCNGYEEYFLNLNSINLSLDESIYRIFSLDKFKKTIKDKKLCLVRPCKWEDPFENFLLNSEGLYNGKRVGFGNIRDKFYGQCWTKKKECDGLWRNYKGDEPAAIKVKTTVGKLMNQFYDFTSEPHQLSYFIGKVDYVSDDEIINFFKDEIDMTKFDDGIKFVQTLLKKRLSFAYEEEVRVIFNKPNNIRKIDLLKNNKTGVNLDLFFVDIDPNTLFTEIEFDPWLSLEDSDLLKKEIINLGYTGLIKHSTLYDKPFFVAKIKF